MMNCQKMGTGGLRARLCAFVYCFLLPKAKKLLKENAPRILLTNQINDKLLKSNEIHCHLSVIIMISSKIGDPDILFSAQSLQDDGLLTKAAAQSSNEFSPCNQSVCSISFCQDEHVCHLEHDFIQNSRKSAACDVSSSSSVR